MLVETLWSNWRPLADYLIRQRWFGAKGRQIVDVRLIDHAVLSGIDHPALLTLLKVEYREGSPQIYLLPLIIRPCDGMDDSIDPGNTFLILQGSKAAADVRDATSDTEACLSLLEGIRQQACWQGAVGTFTCVRTVALESVPADPFQRVKRIAGEQSNTSVVYDQALILKVIRKLEAGLNPDCEVMEFLTLRTAYRHVPRLLGYMRYDAPEGTEAGQASGFSATAATLQRFIPNEGDGWNDTVQHLNALIEHGRRAFAMTGKATDARVLVRDFSHDFFRRTRRLGQITAELHVALASDPTYPSFRPEPITEADVAQWRQAMETQVRDTMDQFRFSLSNTTASSLIRKDSLAALKAGCLEQLKDLSLLLSTSTMKIRIHGDYHLGQVLKTGEEFVILDFEGEPARSLRERRAKACPLKDVAGMLRSFSYARHVVLRELRSSGAGSTEADSSLMGAWEEAVADFFLNGYREVANHGTVRFLPESASSVERVLRVFQLDKAIYELRYELNNRPDWIDIPLQGLQRLVANQLLQPK
ncbi:MAG: hypothetical protein C4293_13160 [Nitrospiraceae bacterium]